MRDLLRLGMDVARLNFRTAHTKTTPATSSACAAPLKKKTAPSASCRICKAPKSALDASSATNPCC